MGRKREPSVGMGTPNDTTYREAFEACLADAHREGDSCIMRPAQGMEEWVIIFVTGVREVKEVVQAVKGVTENWDYTKIVS